MAVMAVIETPKPIEVSMPNFPRAIQVEVQPFEEASGELHSVLFTPQKLTESQQKQARENIGVMELRTDKTLSLSKENVLSVNTAPNVEEDNTLPITAAAVYNTVGNIEILLGTI